MVIGATDRTRLQLRGDSLQELMMMQYRSWKTASVAPEYPESGGKSYFLNITDVIEHVASQWLRNVDSKEQFSHFK